jgi:hypothetical protein
MLTGLQDFLKIITEIYTAKEKSGVGGSYHESVAPAEHAYRRASLERKDIGRSQRPVSPAERLDAVRHKHFHVVRHQRDSTTNKRRHNETIILPTLCSPLLEADNTYKMYFHGKFSYMNGTTETAFAGRVELNDF